MDETDEGKTPIQSIHNLAHLNHMRASTKGVDFMNEIGCLNYLTDVPEFMKNLSLFEGYKLKTEIVL